MQGLLPHLRDRRYRTVVKTTTWILLAALLLAAFFLPTIRTRSAHTTIAAASSSLALLMCTILVEVDWSATHMTSIHRRTCALLLATGWLAWLSALIDACKRPDPLTDGLFWSIAAVACGVGVVRVLKLNGHAFAKALTVVAVALAVSVLLDAAFVFGARANVVRPAGLLMNRNWSAEYLALCLPFVLSVPKKRTWTRVASVASGVLASVIVVAAIALTRSRTAWCVSALGVTCLVLLGRRTGNVRGRLRDLSANVMGGCCGIGLALLLPWRLGWIESHPFGSSLQRLHDLQAGSGHVRLMQYAAVPPLLHGHWLFGRGAGEWQGAEAGFDQNLALNVYPHSEWVRVLVEGGLRLALPLAISIGALLFLAFRSRQRQPVIGASILAFVLTSLADVPLARLESALLFGVLVGALLNHADNRTALATKPPKNSAAFRKAVSAEEPHPTHLHQAS